MQAVNFNMAGTVFLVALFSLFSTAYSATYNCQGVAQYWLTFYGNWSNMTHPNAFPFIPAIGRFSPLVGASHESAYTLWMSGTKASEGVKNVAESGNSTELEREIMQHIMGTKTAWQQIKSGNMPINGTGSVMNIEVEVTKDFPYVSLVTMLAPSPDWFTGIMKTSLCDTSSGTWRDSWAINNIQPWDAGTDDGAKFDAENNATMPPGDITQITKTAPPPSDFMNIPWPIPTLGKLMFTRRNKPTMNQCSDMYYYTVKFEAKWSQATHPNGFPSGAHFSPLVIATHSYKYKMWSDMTRASPGVKLVAETGAERILYNGVDMMMKPGFVSNVYKTGSVSSPGGYKSTQIMVQNMYSMVSLITMIAPSPDWFVGVDSFDLCGINGWKESETMDLLPWDAGTDSGENFGSTDMPTTPVDVIRRITSSSMTQMDADADKAFATVTFTRGEMITTTTTARTTTTERTTTTDSSSPGLSAGLFAFLSVSLLAIIGVLY